MNGQFNFLGLHGLRPLSSSHKELILKLRLLWHLVGLPWMGDQPILSYYGLGTVAFSDSALIQKLWICRNRLTGWSTHLQLSRIGPFAIFRLRTNSETEFFNRLIEHIKIPPIRIRLDTIFSVFVHHDANTSCNMNFNTERSHQIVDFYNAVNPTLWTRNIPRFPFLPAAFIERNSLLKWLYLSSTAV